MSTETTEHTVLKVKRKRNRTEPQETLVIETQPKRTVLNELVEKFATLETTPQHTSSSEDKKADKLQERKLFRFAYTITDSSKLREFGRGLQKFQTQNARRKVVQQARENTSEETSDYVIDVYYRDNKVSTEELQQYNAVTIESFADDLVFENEYDSASDSADEEDSNGKEWDYPEEEECSDDSSNNNDYDDRSKKKHHWGEFEYGLSDDSEEDDEYEDKKISFGNYAYDPYGDAENDEDDN